jgi:tripeptidyl-peptidase I
MRFSFANAVLGALTVRALALPTSHIDHVVHEKRDNIQRKWIQSNALDSDYVLPARIGLKQSNLHLGEQYLNDV